MTSASPRTRNRQWSLPRLPRCACSKPKLDIAPVVAAGHSLGEYSALVAAGALSFPDAVRAVRERGRLMQEACPPGQGAMAALIGLEPDAVNEICATVSEGGQIAVPANLNAPGQIVIAGHAAPVRRAIEIAKERGATMSVELKVSAPFHCALMKPAQDGMTPILRGLKISPLKFPVIANVTATPNSDAAKVADLLIAQITAPVRWAESMEQLGKLGVTDAIEFGCGKVLMGLMRRINKNIRVRPLEDLASLKAVGEAFAQPKAESPSLGTDRRRWIGARRTCLSRINSICSPNRLIDPAAASELPRRNRNPDG